MRALRYVVLPDEDAVEFQTLEGALVDELAPEGALQLVLARRVAVAALAAGARRSVGRRTGWGPVPQRGGQQVELFEERRWEGAGVGVALIRDGNGTRSFETLLRYPRRRDGRVLAGAQDAEGAPGRAGQGRAARARAGVGCVPLPAESNPTAPAWVRLHHVTGGPSASGVLHEAAVPWLPNEPDRGGVRTVTGPRRPRSSGSNTTSSLMPSGSAKKTA